MSDIPLPDSSPTPPAPSCAPSTIPPVLPLVPPSTPLSPATVASQKRLETRIWCSFIFFACASMMALALYLHPNPSGAGTHQQLGFPPCGLLQTTGIPCPTCGCTTSVTLLAHGHPVDSFITQPFGFAVGILALLLLPLTLYGALTGLWKGPSMFMLGWYWRYWVYGSLAVLVLAWVYKVIAVQFHMSF